MNDSADGKTYAIFDRAANRKIIADVGRSAKVLTFPPVNTENLLNDGARESLTNGLDVCDWLIFTDVLTVDYFLETLENSDYEMFELDTRRVCAFGEATCDRLRFASLHADVIVARMDAATAFASLVSYIGADAVGGLKFLLLSGEANESELAGNLRELHAEVSEMNVYRIIPSDSSALTKLKTLLRGGAIDEFILTDPTDFIALRHYFTGENLAAMLQGVAITAENPVMFQTAREHDLPRVKLLAREKNIVI